MRENTFKLLSLALTAVLAIGFTATGAFGAGFALIEQSGSELATAYAGAAASCRDASTIYFNPAGLTCLKGVNVSAAAHLVMPSTEFTNENSTHVLQGMTGVGLTGNDGGNAGVTAVVPSLYVSKSLSEKFSIGIGLSVPFGLGTEYNNTWVGRYHSIKSDVMTANINPSVAVKLSDQVSLGFGVSLQYLEAELSNAIDFGTLDASGAFAALGIPAGAMGLVPQANDGFATVEGDSWAMGFNLGILLKPTEKTRMGISYRSDVSHKIEGDVDFSNVPAALDAAPLFKDGGATADITLPGSASISLAHNCTDKITALVDITWTDWSKLEELRIAFDNPYQDDSATLYDWKDNLRYSAGLDYRYNDSMTLKAGIAYDETPIPDPQHRTPRLPGEDRLWTALGLNYRFSGSLSLDAAYAHLFMDDPRIGRTPSGEDLVRGGLSGYYDAQVDIVSVQLNYRF